MVSVLVMHRVADFGKWKPFYDGHAATRMKSGCKAARVLRSSNDPNSIVLLFEWDSAENAMKFGMSEDLKKTMMEAGVLGKPDFHILDEVEKTQF